MERISARAVLLTDQNQVVLVHRVKDGAEYWVTPGGGVEAGESAEEAVRREVREEVGVSVIVEAKLLEVRKEVEGVQTVQLFFLCRQQGGTVGTGSGREFSQPDPHNVYEIVTVGKEEAAVLNILPSEIKTHIVRLLTGAAQ
jgi:mutator protein MutT